MVKIGVTISNMQAVADTLHDLHRQSYERFIGCAVNSLVAYIEAAAAGELPGDDLSFATWFESVGGIS